jgi:CheY-like chemotaxis protein
VEEDLSDSSQQPRSPAPVVLVVDDDPDVLLVAASILGQQGYSVLEASSGAEALDLLRQRPEIAILFTDIVMPGDVDGFELAHQARLLRPALRIVYTSGYIEKIPWGEKGIGYGPLLPKPWNREQLLAMIGSLLKPSG